MNEDIKFKITLDGKEFLATADLSDDAIDRLTNKLTDVKKKGGDSFTSLASQWGNIVTGFNQGLQIINQVYDVVSRPIKIAAQFEGFEVQLRVMLGSATLAKQRLKELSDFAASTPFTLPQVVEAGNKLQALGRYSVETLRYLGDLSSASGKPIDQVLSAYAKLASGQKGIAIDMFRDLLITTDDWAKATGARFSKSGEIQASWQQMAEALPKIIKEKGFDGMMAEQSKTLAGMGSNMEDAMTQLGNTVGQAFLEPTKKGFTELTGTINDLKNIVDGLSAAWKSLTGINVPGWLQDVGTVVLYISSPIVALIKLLKETIHWLGETLKTDATTDPYKKQIDSFTANVEKRKKLKKELESLETKSREIEIDRAKKASAEANKSAEERAAAESKYYSKQRQLQSASLADYAGYTEKMKRLAEKAEADLTPEAESDAARENRIKLEQKAQADAEAYSNSFAASRKSNEVWSDFLANTQNSFRIVGDNLLDAMAMGMTGAKVKWGQLVRDLGMMLLRSGIKNILISIFNLALGGTSIGNFLGFKAAAKGAIIDEPTLLLAGEAGREYYVPEQNMAQIISALLSGKTAEAPGGGSSINSAISNLVRNYAGGSVSSVANSYRQSVLSPGNNELVNEIRSLHDTLIHKDMTSVFAGDLKDDKIFERQRIEKGVRIKYTM